MQRLIEYLTDSLTVSLSYIINPMSDDTSIRVSEELADRLFELKNRGDSYEDVIWLLLEAYEENEK